MTFDVEEFVHYQIANAPVRAYPYPHFYLQPVFPETFYRRMLETMPDTEALTPINEFGTVGIVDPKTGQRIKSAFEPRYIADLSVLEAEARCAAVNDTGMIRSATTRRAPTT